MSGARSGPSAGAVQLLNEPYLRIWRDPEGGWLYADWTGYQTVESVKDGCEHILRLMVEQSTFRILNDNTHVLGIWSGASEWVGTDWFPRMAAAGLRGFAWVYSPSRFSQLSTDESLAAMAPNAQVQVFPEVEKARAWLRACV